MLGGIPHKALFGNEKALGKEIDYNGQKFKVVGVTEDKQEEGNLFSEGGFENVIYVPYAYMKTKVKDLQITRRNGHPRRETHRLYALCEHRPVWPDARNAGRGHE